VSLQFINKIIYGSLIKCIVVLMAVLLLVLTQVLGAAIFAIVINIECD